jgi:hypothetical protein
MSRSIIRSALVLAAASALCWLAVAPGGRQRDAQSSRPAPKPIDEARATDQKASHPSPSASASQRRPSAPVAAQAATPLPQPTEEPFATEGEAPAPTEETDEQMHKRRLAHAESSFRAEPTDQAWSSATRTELERAMSSVAEELGSTIAPIECHTTLCRIELVNDSPEMARETLNTFIRSNQWPGEGMAIPIFEENGRTTIHVYVAKPGFKVPEPGPA